ncbi:MAG: DUF4340 domain-containing protein [Planctomycetota bacterium]
MSSRAVVIACVLAGVLIVVAYVLTAKPGSNASPSGPQASTPAESRPITFGFEQGDVAAFEIFRPGARAERIERNDRGVWRWPVTNEIDWPVSLPLIAQRVMASWGTLDATALRAPEATVPEDTLAIRFELSDGTVHEVRASPDQVGGRVAVTLDGSDPVLVDDAWIGAVTDPGPSAWRTPLAIPGARNASRIRIESELGVLALASVGGEWTMREPIAARAEPNAVAQLIDALTGLGVHRFADDVRGTPESFGLDSPRLRFTIETDQRVAMPDGETRVVTRERRLLVGEIADAAGERLYAAPDEDASLLLEVPTVLLNETLIPTLAFAANTAVQTRPLDVSMLIIKGGEALDDSFESRGFRRGTSGWQTMSGEQTPGAPLDALLDFLFQTPGEVDPVSLRAPGAVEARFVPARRVELLGAGGEPLERVSLGYLRSGALALRSGPLLITYPNTDPPPIIALPPAEEVIGSAARESLPTGAPVESK